MKTSTNLVPSPSLAVATRFMAWKSRIQGPTHCTLPCSALKRIPLKSVRLLAHLGKHTHRQYTKHSPAWRPGQAPVAHCNIERYVFENQRALAFNALMRRSNAASTSSFPMSVSYAAVMLGLYFIVATDIPGNGSIAPNRPSIAMIRGTRRSYLSFLLFLQHGIEKHGTLA